jgi:ABC-type amino acid transport substrate-binding protein
MTSAPSSARDLPEIQESGELRVIVAADEQPERFNMSSAGQPGIERELVEGFTRLHKLKLVPVSVPRYRNRIPALLEGQGDVILGIIDTPARREVIQITNEVMPSRWVVVTHEPHRVVESVAQLLEEKVGILAGTTTWLKATLDAGVPDEKIARLNDVEAVIEALRSGQITATVMSISDYGLAKRKHPGLQAGLAVGGTSSAAWGVRKEDVELAQALNEYITSVRKTPTWSRLVVQYFGEETLLVLGKR